MDNHSINSSMDDHSDMSSLPSNDNPSHGPSPDVFAMLRAMYPPVVNKQIQSLKEFHVFTKLPIELQCRTWTLYLRGQIRVIEIDGFEGKQKSKAGKKRFTSKLRFYSKTLAPAILHVSANARKEGLKFYRKLNLTGMFSGTYINYDFDYVMFKMVSTKDKLGEGPDKHHNLVLAFLRAERRLKSHIRSEIGAKCQRVLVKDHLLDCNFDVKEVIKLLPSMKNVVLAYGWANATQHGNIILPASRYLTAFTLSGNAHDLEAFARICLQEGWELPRYSWLHYLIRRDGRQLLIRASEQRVKEELRAPIKPKMPKKRSFRHCTIAQLREIAAERDLDNSILKLELVERISVSEQPAFEMTMEKYEKHMEEHNKALHNYYLNKNPGATE